MNVVMLDGWLGNQTFQYIFARWLMEKSKKPVLLDDSFYFLIKDERTYGSPELMDLYTQDKRDGIEMHYAFPKLKLPKLLSEHFSSGEWQEMIESAIGSRYLTNAKDEKHPNYNLSKSIPEQLTHKWHDVSIIYEHDSASITGNNPNTYKLHPGSTYNSNLASPPPASSYYYFGYWLNAGYYRSAKKHLVRELTFRKVTDSENKSLVSAILKASPSIGVHVRRKDYALWGYAPSARNFRSVISKLSEGFNTAFFFVFSDEPDWVLENSSEMGLPPGRFVIVRNNLEIRQAYIDMYLMTLCEVLVVCSLFSFLASVLNTRPSFVPFYMRPYPLDTTDTRQALVKKPLLN